MSWKEPSLPNLKVHECEPNPQPLAYAGWNKANSTHSSMFRTWSRDILAFNVGWCLLTPMSLANGVSNDWMVRKNMIALTLWMASLAFYVAKKPEGQKCKHWEHFDQRKAKKLWDMTQTCQDIWTCSIEISLMEPRKSLPHFGANIGQLAGEDHPNPTKTHGLNHAPRILACLVPFICFIFTFFWVFFAVQS